VVLPKDLYIDPIQVISTEEVYQPVFCSRRVQNKGAVLIWRVDCNFKVRKYIGEIAVISTRR
jgi:hypothetical protein